MIGWNHWKLMQSGGILLNVYCVKLKLGFLELNLLKYFKTDVLKLKFLEFNWLKCFKIEFFVYFHVISILIVNPRRLISMQGIVLDLKKLKLPPKTNKTKVRLGTNERLVQVEYKAVEKSLRWRRPHNKRKFFISQWWKIWQSEHTMSISMEDPNENEEVNNCLANNHIE